MSEQSKHHHEENEEDFDFMSPKFVQEEPSNKKKQPSTEQQKPRHLLEREARNRALNTPLDQSSTIGFKMLFSRSGPSSHARDQHTSVAQQNIDDLLKQQQKRMGIGRMHEEKQAEQARLEKRKRDQENQEIIDIDTSKQYQRRAIDQHRARRLDQDLRRSREVCEHLDSRKGLCRHIYWPLPDRKDSPTSDADSLDEPSHNQSTERQHGKWFEELDDVEEKLRLVTRYLRQTHHYCLWCGTEFENAADMECECPGSNWEDHQD